MEMHSWAISIGTIVMGVMPTAAVPAQVAATPKISVVSTTNDSIQRVRVGNFVVHLAEAMPSLLARIAVKDPSLSGRPLTDIVGDTTAELERFRRLGVPSGLEVTNRWLDPSPLKPLAWADSFRTLWDRFGDEAGVRTWWGYGGNFRTEIEPVLLYLADRGAIPVPMRRFAESLIQNSTIVVDRDVAARMSALGYALGGAAALAQNDTAGAVRFWFNAARVHESSLASVAAARLVPLTRAQHDTVQWISALTLNHLLSYSLDTTQLALLRTIYSVYVSAHGNLPDIIPNRLEDATSSRTMLSFDAFLDRSWSALYERDFPVARSAFVSEASPSVPHRAVVVEYETGLLCSSCSYQDHAFHAMARRYDPDTVIVLAYHQESIISPPIDSAEQRFFAWYPGEYVTPDFRGRRTSIIPRRTLLTATGDTMMNFFVNGHGLPRLDWYLRMLPGSQGLYQRAITRIDDELLRLPGVRLRLDVTKNRGTVQVVVHADSLREMHHALAMRIALVEDTVWVRGGGIRRIYQNVVRDYTQTATLPLGLPLDLVPGAERTIRYTFDLNEIQRRLSSAFDTATVMHVTLDQKDAIQAIAALRAQHPDPRDWHMDWTRLSVVAFIQDLDTGDVLQAIRVKVPSSVGMARH